MEALGRALPPPPTVDFLVRSDITRAELLIDESSLLGYKSRTAKSSLGIDTKLVSASSGAVSEAGSYDAVTEKKSSGIAMPAWPLIPSAHTMPVFESAGEPKRAI